MVAEKLGYAACSFGVPAPQFPFAALERGGGRLRRVNAYSGPWIATFTISLNRLSTSEQ